MPTYHGVIKIFQRILYLYISKNVDSASHNFNHYWSQKDNQVESFLLSIFVLGYLTEDKWKEVVSHWGLTLVLWLRARLPIQYMNFYAAGSGDKST
jgi:hypothetical protein